MLLRYVFCLLALLTISACSSGGGGGGGDLEFTAPSSGATAPSFSSSTTTINSSSNQASYTFSGTCSVDGSSISISGALSSSATCQNGTWSATVNTTGLIEGANSVTISDGTHTASVTINKDTQAPSVALTTATTVKMNTGNVTSFALAGTCSEDGRVVAITVAIGITANATCSGGAFSSNVNVSTATDGTVAVALSHTDSAGNSASASANFTKDTLRPTLADNSSIASSTNAGTLALTFTLSENVTGFTQADLNFTNASVATGLNCGAGNTCTISITPGAVGTVSVGVNAGGFTDDNGNDNAAATIFTTIYDTTAPTITGIANDATPTKSKSWSWSCNKTCTYRYVIDTTSNTAPNGAYGSTTSDSQTSGSNTYYIHIEAKDVAGNTSVGHFSAILDNTAPTAPAAPADGTAKNSLTASPTISWTASNDTNGVTAYYYAIGTTAGGNNIKDWTSNGTTLNVTASGLSLTDNTTYYASVRAVDAAGNISTVAQADGWLTDMTSPSDPGSVNDGTTYASLSSSPTITWNASTDTGGSGISYYQIAVGSTAGGTDMKTWTNVGNVTSASVSGMTLTANTTYYASVRAVDAAGNTSTTLGDGWQATLPGENYYYANSALFNFDGTDTETGFKDKSSSDHTLTTFGNTSISAKSKFNGSLYLDGSGDYITIPHSSAFDLGSGDFTIEFWYNWDGSAGNQYITGKYTSGSAWAIGIESGNVVAYFYTGGGTVSVASGAPVANTWQHMAITRSGSSWKYFLNGSQVGMTQTNSTSVNSSTGELYIGDLGSGFLGNDFGGYIDDFRIVKGTALYTSNFTPPSELSVVSGTSLLLNFNGMYDFSPSQHSTAVFGHAKISTTASKFGDASLALDGTGDYLSMPDSSAFDFAGGDFTIEGWVNLSALPANGGYATLWGQWNASDAAACAAALFVTNSSGVYQLAGFWHNGSTQSKYENITISTGSWYHFAFVRSGNNGKLFWNGTQLGTDFALTGVVSNSSLPASIGAMRWGAPMDGFVNGYLDDIRITKGIARYTASFTAPTTAHANTQSGTYNVSPSGSAAAGGGTVTISGANFDSTTAVTIGGSSCPVTSFRDGYVKCTIPASGSNGLKDVVITGGGAATLTNGFRYNCAAAPQTITSSQSVSIPAGCSAATIVAVGGGGAGNLAAGSGGSYVSGFYSVTSSLNITIGGAGAQNYGGSASTNGGDTTVVSTGINITAGGGIAPAFNSLSGATSVGAATGGNIANNVGGRGGDTQGACSNAQAGQGGGAGQSTGVGATGTNGSGCANTVAAAGVSYNTNYGRGGGGYGGAGSFSPGAQAGVVEITWY